MKAYRLIIILLVLIIALPFAGRLFWLVKKNRPVNIVIIDKSVWKSSQNEVKTINWTLNNQKFVDSLGELYNYHYDYLGYFPDAVTQDRRIKSFKLEDIPAMVENMDMLFFADNAGIQINRNENKPLSGISYGGFNQNDYFLLKEMINRQKLVVAEYNFIAPPTEDLVCYNTEQFIDVYSLGWIGRYFNDLGKDKVAVLISTSWFDRFKQNYASDWNFSGPGIILLNASQNRVIVLPASKFMSSKYPTVVTTPEVATQYNLPEKAAYSGWFELIHQGKNNVISHFDLNLNQDGVDLLKMNGIESEFPAVVESANKKFYYIAGDFSKVHVFMPSARLGFISSLITGSEKKRTENPDKFFMTYYNFLLSAILNDYYLEIRGVQN